MESISQRGQVSSGIELNPGLFAPFLTNAVPGPSHLVQMLDDQESRFIHSRSGCGLVGVYLTLVLPCVTWSQASTRRRLRDWRTTSRPPRWLLHHVMATSCCGTPMEWCDLSSVPSCLAICADLLVYFDGELVAFAGTTRGLAPRFRPRFVLLSPG